ncbi:unnamed protein product [Hymenolepis diminuta]|uniref:Coatomer subunit delta n=1 Tax=Hymenolepis diminuta TaxID=6216 RepID=A0A0R3SLA2_HYMDI|nr:unnamed protein product [Hymenolepis diminuta]
MLTFQQTILCRIMGLVAGQESKRPSKVEDQQSHGLKDEDEASELAFFEKTESETSAKSINDAYIMVNIFVFTHGHVEVSIGSDEERAVVTNARTQLTNHVRII